MIIKLTLAIVTCPRSSILIQNHSAFHEHLACKSQIKASSSLEIVKKTSRDLKQRSKNWFAIECCLDVVLFPLLMGISISEIWPDFRESWLPFPFFLFIYCSTRSQSKNSMNIRLPQSLTRRRPADQRACGLWVRDCISRFNFSQAHARH